MIAPGFRRISSARTVSSGNCGHPVLFIRGTNLAGTVDASSLAYITGVPPGS
jgi:hypothetical protein